MTQTINGLTSPEEFVTRNLVGSLQASAVVAVPDFRFGRGRAVDVDLLDRLGQSHGSATHVVPQLERGGIRIKSSRIRDAIRSGDLQTAIRLLGQEWTIGIRKDSGFWRVDPDQILPPAGDWPVKICSPLGIVLDETVVHLDNDCRLHLPEAESGHILRWKM